MKILYVAIGTRGDVQPAIALCKALKANGHDATVTAGADFADLAEKHGVPFIPLSFSMDDMMQREDAIAWVESRGNRLREMKYMGQIAENTSWDIALELAEIVPDFDLVMSGFLTFTTMVSLSHKYGFKVVNVMLQPFVPTRMPEANNYVLFPRYNALNLIVGHAALWFMWNVLGKGNNRLADHIGTPRLTHGDFQRLWINADTLYGVSPIVLPQPPDWKDSHYVAGYWRLPESDAYTPPDDLQRFLSHEQKPVYLGFGSMTRSNPQELAELVFTAFERAGVRGLVYRGTAFPDIEAPNDNIMLFDGAPHDWLFPQVAGAVHHGGAGTTAAGLYAGIPALIVPHLGDQAYYGKRVHAIGAGLKPIEQHKLTTGRLTETLKRLSGDEQLHVNSQRIAERLQDEDGLKRAVAWIEHLR